MRFGVETEAGEGGTMTRTLAVPVLLASAGSMTADVGTRLLVSGEPRWGGEPLEDPLAWTCGFTQPWSEDAAAEWEAATA